jgi:hypothetical protein
MLAVSESCGLFEGTRRLGRGDKNLIILPTTTWTATKWRETFEEQDWKWTAKNILADFDDNSKFALCL